MNQMPINKKEHMLFTFLMVFFMAIVMSTYNVVIHEGFTRKAIEIAWMTFPITFVLAFLCEWFIVGPMAMALIKRFVKENDPLLKKVMLSALFFVTGMVIMMSFLCSLVFTPFDSAWTSNWLMAMPRNFMMAYPLQVLIAGPLVLTVFRKLFPVGTIVHPTAE